MDVDVPGPFTENTVNLDKKEGFIVAGFANLGQATQEMEECLAISEEAAGEFSDDASVGRDQILVQQVGQMWSGASVMIYPDGGVNQNHDLTPSASGPGSGSKSSTGSERRRGMYCKFG
jgi:hypothetical protein